MNDPLFDVRPLQKSDVPGAVKLSADAGWNQTAADWKFLIDTPGHISLAAVLSDQIIGTTIATNYANQLAWIGMVLVDTNYQGKGISKKLLSGILEQTASMRAIKLDATPQGQKIYQKFDFKAEFEISRLTLQLPLIPETFDAVGCAPAEQTDGPDIIALDAEVFGANRFHLLSWLLTTNSGKSFVTRKNGCITGFATGRSGRKYYQVGPVSAGTVAEAKILIASVLKTFKSHPIVVDVLNDKQGLIDWLITLGFQKEREFTRMYKNQNAFAGKTGKQFLICGPEFG